MALLAVASAAGAAIAIPQLVSGQSPPAPTVSTGKSSQIEVGSAVVNGFVNSNGSATTYSFRYGPTARYGRHTNPVALPAGSGPVAVEARLRNLEPGVRYHYRVVASNPFGTAEGEDRTFESAAPVLTGLYPVRTRVVAGGRPFGQHRGDGALRQYRFKLRCSGGACTDVSLRRAGQRGRFGSLLRQRGIGRWSGIETHRGYCDNGLKFGSRTRITVRAENVAAGRINRIAGQLHTVVRGCVKGSERATFTGRRR